MPIGVGGKENWRGMADGKWVGSGRLNSHNLEGQGYVDFP